MSLGKKVIVKNISSRAQLSRTDSKIFLEYFLCLIKNKSLGCDLKISNFGTFNSKVSPERIGRNPKTFQQFLIPKKNKTHFYPSNKIKSLLN